MAPRNGEYRKFGDEEMPFPKGTRVFITKRSSLYFDRDGEVVAVGVNNKNIRLVKIAGVKTLIPFLISELSK